MAKTMEDMVKEQLGLMNFVLLQKEVIISQLVEENDALKKHQKEQSDLKE